MFKLLLPALLALAPVYCASYDSSDDDKQVGERKYRASFETQSDWAHIERTKVSFEFKQMPVTMNMTVHYRLRNTSKHYHIVSFLDTKIRLSKMQYRMPNPSDSSKVIIADCIKTSGVIKRNMPKIQLGPNSYKDVSFTFSLIPFAYGPIELYRRKIKEGSSSKIKIQCLPELESDFYFVDRK